MKQVEFEGTTHEFPDDFTDQDISKALQGASGPAVATNAQPQAQPGAMTPETAQAVLGMRMPGAVPGSGAFSPANLPDVLATLGGALPGVRAIGGMAGGRGLGETIKQGLGTLLGQPMDPGAIASQTKRGAIEGVTGYGASKVLSGVGGTITGRRLAKAAAKTKTVVDQATQTGKRYDPLRLLDGFAKMHQEIAELDPVAAQSLGKVANRFMANKQGPQTPSRILKLRQLADKTADKIHRYEKSGLPVPPMLDAKARLYKLAADNSREMLREIPGVQALDKATQRAIFQRRLVPTGTDGQITTAGQLAGRTGLTSAAAIAGGMSGGAPGAGMAALASILLSQPQIVRALGLLMDNPLTQRLAQQAPRAAYQGLVEPNQE